MVSDLVYKFQMIYLGELKLLSANQLWDGRADIRIRWAP